MTIVICGICNQEIEPKTLKKSVPISEYDKLYSHSRNITYNCCGRTWLRSTIDGSPVDCGKAIEE